MELRPTTNGNNGNNLETGQGKPYTTMTSSVGPITIGLVKTTGFTNEEMNRTIKLPQIPRRRLDQRRSKWRWIGSGWNTINPWIDRNNDWGNHRSSEENDGDDWNTDGKGIHDTSNDGPGQENDGR
jgi:hypothetical protein